MQPSSSSRRNVNIWPGFVDALSALLLVIVFLLLIFTVGQFLLSITLTGKEKRITELDRVTAELSALLATEKATAADMQQRVGKLTEQLLGKSENIADLQTDVELLAELRQQLEKEVQSLSAELRTSHEALETEQELSARSVAQIQLINRQVKMLREHLSAISQVLGLEMNPDDENLEQFSRELNRSLLQMVQKLAYYRSNFFGRLRDVLGNNPNIQIVGDRFILQSELLFDTASATLGERGRRQVRSLARIITEVASEIPDDIDWVIRIDGHTDSRKINTPEFPSNWELSTARALAIVRYMIEQGVPAERLAATGFGEYHPLDASDSEEAYSRNRRIEIKLTAK